MGSCDCYSLFFSLCCLFIYIENTIWSGYYLLAFELHLFYFIFRF